MDNLDFPSTGSGACFCRFRPLIAAVGIDALTCVATEEFFNIIGPKIG